MRYHAAAPKVILLLLAGLTSACERPLQVSAVAGVRPPPDAPFLGSTEATVDGIFLDMTNVVAKADSPTDVEMVLYSSYLVPGSSQTRARCRRHSQTPG